jgi:hypothetical protein
MGWAAVNESGGEGCCLGARLLRQNKPEEPKWEGTGRFERHPARDLGQLCTFRKTGFGFFERFLDIAIG